MHDKQSKGNTTLRAVRDSQRKNLKGLVIIHNNFEQCCAGRYEINSTASKGYSHCARDSSLKSLNNTTVKISAVQPAQTVALQSQFTTVTAKVWPTCNYAARL